MTVTPPTAASQPPRDPGLYFRPNSRAQARFMASAAPEILISSAYGKGKTRILCEKAWWLCLAYPGCEIVLARKQRAHMAPVIRCLLSEVVHQAFVSNGWRQTAEGGSTLFAPNGSRILIIGLDNPGRARSSEFTAAYVDQAEELDEEEWNAIAGRLRHPIGPYRQIGAACNPESPDHFLYKKFRPDLGSHISRSAEDEFLPDGTIVPAGRILTELILSGAKDNYENLPVDYLLRLSRYKGRYYKRYVLGLWVAFEGQIYDVWDPDIHLIDRPESWSKWGGYPPPEWPRYRGFDFGYRNPFVAQWWARDPDGVWFLYREIYMSGRTIAAQAPRIKEFEDREVRVLNECIERENKLKPNSHEHLDFLPIAASVADHDAGERAILQDEQIWSNPADKDVPSGIQYVYEMMQPIEINGTPRPRLHILRDCLVERDETLEAQNMPTCTAEEIAAYRYEKVRDAGEKSPKEQPRKLNDHGCDCMRYVLYTARQYGTSELVVI